MKGLQSLRSRLLAAQSLLVVIVVGAGLGTVRLLTPVFFSRGQRNEEGQLQRSGQGQLGNGQTVPQEIQDSYASALSNSVLVAAIIGFILAAVLTIVFSRLLLRRLNEVDRAAKRLAAGDYQHRIAQPPESELAGLASSINTLGATLAASEQARARLMSDVAHEIRNPLTTIEGYMEGLIDGVLPAETSTYSDVADEARRLRRIAEDLSFMSRADEGAVRYETDNVDLSMVARHACERLSPAADAAGTTLDVECDRRLSVLADSGRVTQALTNVINNAIAHTPPGGAVTVRCSSTTSMGVVLVTDTGEGIPEDRLEVIFERFTRFRDGAGIGIGLHIARSIAEGQGGSLVATSPGPGKGATFTLSLPAS